MNIEITDLVCRYHFDSIMKWQQENTQEATYLEVTKGGDNYLELAKITRV